MPRSDSILNTGMTSASMNKAERMRVHRESRLRTKLEKKTKLAPAVEVVFDELIKERDRTTMSILEVVDAPATSDTSYRANIQALQLYRESMLALKTRLSNIMRVEQE